MRFTLRMLLRCTHLAVMVLVLAATVDRAYAQGKKYAVLIGVKDCDPSILTPLQFAEDDVVAMSQALEKHGFDVITMTARARIPAHKPSTPARILAVLDSRLRGLVSADTLVVALSGHGVQFKDDKPQSDGSKEVVSKLSVGA